MMFEHRSCANFHVLCPEIIVDSRTAVRVREKELAVLTLEYPDGDWGDIADERMLTSNGLRLLYFLKNSGAILATYCIVLRRLFLR